jgi:hypothetical protein
MKWGQNGVKSTLVKMGSSLLLTLINFKQGSTVDLTPFLINFKQGSTVDLTPFLNATRTGRKIFVENPILLFIESQWCQPE